MKLGKFLLLIMVLIIAACGDKAENPTLDNSTTTVNPTTIQEGKTVIQGTIQKSEGIQAYLDRMQLSGGNVIVDRKVLGADGTFAFEVDKSPAIYRLRLGSKNIFIPIDGTQSNVVVDGHLATIDQYLYTINGSKEAEQYRQILEHFIKNPPTEDDIANFVDSTSNPLAAAILVMQVFDMARVQFDNPNSILEIHKNANSKLIAAYPNTPYPQEYSAYIGNIQQLLSQQRIQVGAIAPDIELPNPDETKTYKLSDLKGKVVLLDFWASWCRPCRINNPEVVRVYNKYKNKGFTVYSVSLDGVDPRIVNNLSADQIKQQEERARQRWKSAIEQDNLTWDYHVSDLQYWQCAPAKEYGVSSIPRTFLLDKDGRIAVVNPRGPQLEEAVKKLL